MKTCRFCQMPVTDGGAAHEVCIARAAKAQLLDDLEHGLASMATPRHVGRSPRAAYLMGLAMAHNPIADQRAYLQGCTLGRPHHGR